MDLGNWRDEKNPARNDRRGDLVLMKGTDAYLRLKGLGRCNFLFLSLRYFLGPY